MPTARKGLWLNSSSWSAKAAITLESLRDSTVALKGNANNGMPDLHTIFSDMMISKLKKYFILREKSDPLCFDKSLSREERRVPIKPNTIKTKEADIDRTFVPLGILEHNIGSNEGLFKILMEVRNEEKAKPHTPSLLVDCNIYWRVMKVLFCFFLILPVLLLFFFS